MNSNTMYGLEEMVSVDENQPPGDLHIVAKKSFPIALCGYRVKSAWNAKLNTAGRDRCAKCFSIARDKFGGFKP